MTTNDVSDTRISDERLEYLAKWSLYHGLPGQPMTPPDSHLEDPDEIHSILTELLASRTQSPAEWEKISERIAVELSEGKEFPTREFMYDIAKEAAELALRAASIPAPERSKEETSFGVDAAEDEVRKLLHPKKEPDENGFIIGEPVEKFTGEARWEGVLVASYLTTKGQRRYVVEVKPQGFQMIAVPAQLRMIATLETPPLHKEGEDDEALYAWLYPYVCDDGQTRILISEMRKRFAAPAPVPVTITDEMVKRLADELWAHLDLNGHTGDGVRKVARIGLAAALSQKPGEQG